ncbi:hypothetical protein H0H81_003147 [Sphagnurus paluster]|uniref:Uncharacterized protein n=1 Tax=Sphagnurus paluster TaxID=117069 RepID=A0A9P7K6E3_9AGAR|nr:hypothetical protein H0H81_003147 [Sphagnurus paluster]
MDKWQANDAVRREIIYSLRIKYMTRLAFAAMLRREQRRTSRRVLDHEANGVSGAILNLAIAKAVYAHTKFEVMLAALDYYQKIFRVYLKQPLPFRGDLINDDAWLADMGKHGIMALPLDNPVFPSPPGMSVTEYLPY